MAKISTSFANRLSLYICGVVALIFMLVAGGSIAQSEHESSVKAENNAYAQLDIITLRVENILNSVSSAVDNVVVDVITELNRKEPRSERLFEITRRLVEENEIISGSIISLPEYSLDGKQFFAAYSSRNQQDGVITTRQVGNPDYDYTTMDWYSIPKSTGKPYWTDPYFDKGAGEIAMCTYSRPMTDSQGRFIGVFTADLPLEWFNETVSAIKPYESSYNLMVSKDASYIVHTDKSRILHETIFTATRNMEDSTVQLIGREMVAGHRGKQILQNDDTRSMVFYTPVPSNMWSVAMVCPLDDIYNGTYQLCLMLAITFLVALILLFIVVNFVIRRVAKPLQSFSESARIIAKGDFHAPLPKIRSKDEMMVLKDSFRFMQNSLTDHMDRLKSTTAAKERIESELNIARDIQMSMINKIFPPFPSRRDIDVYALMQPAKEVGGDMYDYFLEGDKLYFAIGDVSGKGVPASLFMAMTISIFRSTAKTLSLPSEIVSSMNNALCSNNTANMFVTLFAGIVDLTTGEMTYCNAGHNPPILLSKSGKHEIVDVSKCSGLPVGIFSDYTYVDSTTTISRNDSLILYTDGLTEAENGKQQLYDTDRLLATLSRQGVASLNAKDLLETVLADVEGFVAGAPQSDDLTIMVMQFYGNDNCEKEVPTLTENDTDNDQSANYRKIELINEISQLTLMSEWIEQICKDYEVSDAVTMNINLALEEAVANVIMYAWQDKEKHCFTVDFDMKDDSTAIWRIVDSGKPFAPTVKEDYDHTLDVMERPIGGLGILMVKEIMDEVTYIRKEGHNILTMKINLKK